MNLKSFREDKLKIKTQSEFAELLGVDQSNISRWEKDPNSISYEMISLILNKTGSNFEELTGWEKPVPEALEPTNTWEKADFTKYSLADYITKRLSDYDIDAIQKENYVDQLQSGIETILVKPKVTIVGRSDTGKSTMINALLGNNRMPTSWTPTTSIAVYLKHIDDKPTYIEEDVWVFKNNVDNEQFWDEGRLDDESYCRKWKLAGGGIEMLKSFGTRQGEYYKKSAGSAVVFIDAPILKNCDIVDLPGFGTETALDDEITFSVAKKASVIIYLSQANGFMRIEDITYLKRNILTLPIFEKKGENNLTPLSNLFIVASQAHTVNNGNRNELNKILDVGCENLINTLPEKYWDERQQVSNYTYTKNAAKELRERFFAYSTDILEICAPFNNSLKEIIETLPIITDTLTKGFVRNYVESRKPNLMQEIEKYEKIKDEREKYIDLLNKIKDNELERIKNNDSAKANVRNTISIASRESVNKFSDFLSSNVNIDAIVTQLKTRKVKNKSRDIENFFSCWQSELQEEYKSILETESEKVSREAEKYVETFENNIEKPFDNSDISPSFDARWQFVSTLSKIGTIGGLGGFLISAASGAALFASIGFSAGSSILWGAMTASIWGPIGMAFGLGVAVIMGVIKLFGGGWEKSVAKKAVKQFENERYGEKLISGIREFWEQTENAFNQAAREVEDKWNEYVCDLEKTVNEYDIEEIETKIESLKYIYDFFENIPL